VFQFDEETLEQHGNQPGASPAAVVIAPGIVRGHVGHFSHFLVDYVSVN
jgi:hypothetical protein